MSTKWKLVVLVILTIFIWKAFQYLQLRQPETANIVENPTAETIKVTLYYEALCSDSRNFILKQLVPAYDMLSNYIELELVPYGKAQTIERNGIITFQCQHASVECEANKIHACAVDIIPSTKTLLKYIACMIYDNMIPDQIGQQCANDLSLDYSKISECAKSVRSSLLLKEHGIKTHNVRPAITFIPTVELNGSQKIPLANILKDFKKELCQLISNKPQLCL